MALTAIVPARRSRRSRSAARCGARASRTAHRSRRPPTSPTRLRASPPQRPPSSACWSPGVRAAVARSIPAWWKPFRRPTIGACRPFRPRALCSTALALVWPTRSIHVAMVMYALWPSPPTSGARYVAGWANPRRCKAQSGIRCCTASPMHRPSMSLPPSCALAARCASYTTKGYGAAARWHRYTLWSMRSTTRRWPAVAPSRAYTIRRSGR